jgi:hypothetical protein
MRLNSAQPARQPGPPIFHGELNSSLFFCVTLCGQPAASRSQPAPPASPYRWILELRPMRIASSQSSAGPTSGVSVKNAVVRVHVIHVPVSHSAFPRHPPVMRSFAGNRGAHEPSEAPLAAFDCIPRILCRSGGLGADVAVRVCADRAECALPGARRSGDHRGEWHRRARGFANWGS